MELRKLRYFIALTEELHFERAALRVGVDQPTFSRKIRELERDLGVTLFTRNNQGTRGITAAGNALLPWAQVIVTKIDQAVHAVRELPPASMTSFVLVYATTDLGPFFEQLRTRDSMPRSRFSDL